MTPADPRTPPCQAIYVGHLCERTDDRPTVLHRYLGIICRFHGLVPCTVKERAPTPAVGGTP